MKTTLRVFAYLRRYPLMASAQLFCAIAGTLMVVVFPAPFGPRTPTHCPAGIVNDSDATPCWQGVGTNGGAPENERGAGGRELPVPREELAPDDGNLRRVH